MREILLYHGSKEEVVYPEIRITRYTKDFSWGFYCTNNYHLAFSGACIGLSGAYLSLIYTPLWVEGMIAGRGWIALALVTFGTWRPFRVFLGAYLFGEIGRAHV